MRDHELVRVEVLRLGVRLSVLEQADEHLDLGRSNAVNLRFPVPCHQIGFLHSNQDRQKQSSLGSLDGV